MLNLVKKAAGLMIGLAAANATAADLSSLDGAWRGETISGGAPTTVTLVFSGGGNNVSRTSFNPVSGLSNQTGQTKPTSDPGKFEIVWLSGLPVATPSSDACSLNTATRPTLVCGSLTLLKI
jgi:hypothetical protein